MLSDYIEGISGVGDSTVKIKLCIRTLKIRELKIGSGLCIDEKTNTVIVDNFKLAVDTLQGTIMSENKNAISEQLSTDTMKIAQDLLVDVISGKQPDIPKQISNIGSKINPSLFESFSSNDGLLKLEMFHDMSIKSLEISKVLVGEDNIGLTPDLIKASYTNALNSFQDDLMSVFTRNQKQ
ncbi:MAG: hypothetical protein P857_1050 [Candidatus Xenolissoclinum pacificiensis L6]|uniref:Uncharacterized protein n=1 Tax=Candidatus Xenolissoclinum pacificiensis L6 TaxID=1401685 RepID=W2V0D2_9RICK|nr:MAG: hypothetical protein P857_1050 [Candidatus Xenolissoclinum pacificiensis L6]